MRYLVETNASLQQGYMRFNADTSRGRRCAREKSLLEVRPEFNGCDELVVTYEVSLNVFNQWQSFDWDGRLLFVWDGLVFKQRLKKLVNHFGVPA